MPHVCQQGLRGLRAVTLAAALLAGPTGSAAAAPPDAAVTTPASAARASSPVSLLLINGDKLLLPPGPGRAVAVQQPSGLSGGLFTFLSCTRTFKLPAVALPYLGRGLDPSLFSLSGLEQAERGGRLPVRLSYQGGLPALPGVKVTHSGQGVADGYLTAASARTFGIALRRQFAADHARGSYGTGGLFAHGLSITLPGAPARQRAKASFLMHTLTVTGSNLAGKPDTGDGVFIINLDNCNRLDLPSSLGVFYHGAAKFSVPGGHYWAVGVFGGSSPRLVILPQFTVDHNITVHVSERAATSAVTVRTPRPAKLVYNRFAVLRSNHGLTEGFEWLSFGPLHVSPVHHPPTIGSLQAYTGAQLSSTRGPGIPYTYMLEFPAPPGIIPALHYIARPADLATVRERVYQDVNIGGSGLWDTAGGSPAELAADLISVPIELVPMPGSFLQYLSAGPAMVWGSDEFPYIPIEFLSGQDGGLRSYHAGHVTEDWNRYPLHPTPNVGPPRFAAGAVSPVLPSASRAGNMLTLDITPFGDNQPGHLGSGYVSCAPRLCHGRYTLYQNGVKILSGDAGKAAGFAPDLILRARLGSRPSLIKFVLTASRAGLSVDTGSGPTNRFLLSAASTDTWTWRSRPEPGATVPAPWYCSVTAAHGSPVYHRRCAPQAMTMLRYHVAGLHLNGRTRPGRQSIAITASQIPLAPAFPVTKANMQVSFDGGKSWHAAKVSKISAGNFRAVFNAPAGKLVTLRTHAAGSDGNTVTETIASAYKVSGR